MCPLKWCSPGYKRWAPSQVARRLSCAPRWIWRELACYPGRRGTGRGEAAHCSQPQIPPEKTNQPLIFSQNWNLQGLCCYEWLVDTVLLLHFRRASREGADTNNWTIQIHKWHITIVMCFLNSSSDLLWFKSDTQAQFGHPILFQQFEVWTQCQAKCPGNPFYKPIVFSGVAGSIFGTIPPLQEKHLHQTRTSGKPFL